MTGSGAVPVTDPQQVSGQPELRVRAATTADAPAVYRLVVAAFRARPALDPPADALSETPQRIASEIDTRGGLVAESGSGIVGALIFGTGPGLRLTRVSVDPGSRRQRIAARLVRAAEQLAAERGIALASLVARRELAGTGSFWCGLGYGEVDAERFPERDRVPWNLPLARAVPLSVSVPTEQQMRQLGQRLGGLLRAGDLVILSGALGAGKTTLTQGVGAGLRVRGPITSPTFVLAREHRSTDRGPSLVHVDGYRLGGSVELDDLDLDATADSAVTVVEWGAGIAEALRPDRLMITIDGEDARTVRVDPVGGRWAFADLSRELPATQQPLRTQLSFEAPAVGGGS